MRRILAPQPGCSHFGCAASQLRLILAAEYLVHIEIWALKSQTPKKLANKLKHFP
jgi:hypothetical protein